MENRYISVFKDSYVREIFEELIQGGYENDCYILVPPEFKNENCK